MDTRQAAMEPVKTGDTLWRWHFDRPKSWSVENVTPKTIRIVDAAGHMVQLLRCPDNEDGVVGHRADHRSGRAFYRDPDSVWADQLETLRTAARQAQEALDVACEAWAKWRAHTTYGGGR